MKPVIALIGRPNVGKSTLFNQITKSRDALVADFAGLTRDRKYGDAVYQNKSFIVVDTGGIGENEGGIDSYMAEQSKTAIHEADIIVFVVDARAGLLASDEQIARELRTLGKKVYLVANKVDLGTEEEAQEILEKIASSVEVKPERTFIISGLAKTGVNDLIYALQDLVDEVKQKELEEPEKPKAEEFIWTEPEVRENNRDDDDFDDDEGPEFIYRN